MSGWLLIMVGLGLIGIAATGGIFLVAYAMGEGAKGESGCND